MLAFPIQSLKRMRPRAASLLRERPAEQSYQPGNSFGLILKGLKLFADAEAPAILFPSLSNAHYFVCCRIHSSQVLLLCHRAQTQAFCYLFMYTRSNPLRFIEHVLGEANLHRRFGVYKVFWFIDNISRKKPTLRQGSNKAEPLI